MGTKQSRPMFNRPVRAGRCGAERCAEMDGGPSNDVEVATQIGLGRVGVDGHGLLERRQDRERRVEIAGQVGGGL